MLTILSALGGFLARLLPEILRWRYELQRDSQNHSHEMAMLKLEMQAARQKNDSRLEMISAQGDAAQLPYVYAEPRSGIRGLDIFNGAIRPLVTFVVIAMWMRAKFLVWHLAQKSHYIPANPAFIWTEIIWNQTDTALLFMVATYYFTGRALDKLRTQNS